MRSSDTRRLEAGDLLLVPAWNDHRFENDGDEDLVLLSMSNLPHQAALANHLAREPVDNGAP
jgi:gentisate 1,2-dioxygenase